jgi:hypothetical protein
MTRLAPLLLAVLAACAAKIPVHVDASSRTTLAGYRTYAWLSASPEAKANDREPGVEVFAWSARSAVENALAARGYLRTDADPDLLVLLRTTVGERHSDTLGDFFRYREAGGTQPLFNAFSLGYEEATIVVEAFDAASRTSLWRGRTYVAMDAPHRDRRVVDSVDALLSTFPRREG